MKLIVGLGNPGKEYEKTKHNVGFWVLDAFAHRHQLTFSASKGEAKTGKGHWSAPEGNLPFLLVKPQTFMNLSGTAVQALLHYYKIPLSDLILIFDDLDLDIGRLRLKKKGSAGGHRGVASVIDAVGSDIFTRLKIGIGRNTRTHAADYVLSPFRKEDEKIVLETVEKGTALLPLLIEGRIDEAMNQYNTPLVK